MVRDESSARLKRIILALELMTQVSLPAPSTAQVRVTSSPAQADLPAKLDVSSTVREKNGSEYRHITM